MERLFAFYFAIQPGGGGGHAFGVHVATPDAQPFP